MTHIYRKAISLFSFFAILFLTFILSSPPANAASCSDDGSNLAVMAEQHAYIMRCSKQRPEFARKIVEIYRGCDAGQVSDRLLHIYTSKRDEIYATALNSPSAPPCTDADVEKANATAQSELEKLAAGSENLTGISEEAMAVEMENIDSHCESMRYDCECIAKEYRNRREQSTVEHVQSFQGSFWNQMMSENLCKSTAATSPEESGGPDMTDPNVKEVFAVRCLQNLEGGLSNASYIERCKKVGTSVYADVIARVNKICTNLSSESIDAKEEAMFREGGKQFLLPENAKCEEAQIKNSIMFADSLLFGIIYADNFLPKPNDPGKLEYGTGASTQELEQYTIASCMTTRGASDAFIPREAFCKCYGPRFVKIREEIRAKDSSAPLHSIVPNAESLASTECQQDSSLRIW